MPAIVDVPIGNIVVGHRFRKELGDIPALAEDIGFLGLINPITIDSQMNLLCGQRRLEACRSLGWETILAMIVDMPALLAESSENKMRVNFAPSEAVAIGQAVEDFLGDRRGSNQYQSKELPQNFADAKPGQETREIAAQAAGFGNAETYRQAKIVVDRGTPELVGAMDRQEVAISTAATIAKLPKEMQRTLVKSGQEAAMAGFSGNNEWYTPAKWIEKARDAMGTIDVDPASCSMAQNTVNATQWFDQERDGLQHDWPGNVWLNPPYGRGLIEAFIDKLVVQFKSGITTQAIVLVDNRTDTRWFHELCSMASAVAFTKGRINFYNETVASSSPANGSVFIYLGDHEVAFADEFCADCLVLFTNKTLQ